eukprot:6095307-Pleurochrysis_carterae.AAC.2
MPFNSRSKSATNERKMRMEVDFAVAVKVLQNELLVVDLAAEDPARHARSRDGPNHAYLGSWIDPCTDQQ